MNLTTEREIETRLVEQLWHMTAAYSQCSYSSDQIKIRDLIDSIRDQLGELPSTEIVRTICRASGRRLFFPIQGVQCPSCYAYAQGYYRQYAEREPYKPEIAIVEDSETDYLPCDDCGENLAEPDDYVPKIQPGRRRPELIVTGGGIVIDEYGLILSDYKGACYPASDHGRGFPYVIAPISE